MKRFLAFLFLLSAFAVHASAQSGVKGRVFDADNKPIADVKVFIRGVDSTLTGKDGLYQLSLKPGKYLIYFSHVAFDSARHIQEIRPGAMEVLPVKLTDRNYTIGPVNIVDTAGPTIIKREGDVFMPDLPIKPSELVYSPGKSDLESKLALMAGVSVNNEFSSQYRVRGGNFDENLIYVNDIEVYRPFLIRSGQQEGLGFVNSYLVRNASFSTGGFQSKYADKLSSVLDVEYNTPDETTGSIELGILTTSLHIQGSIHKPDTIEEPHGRFTYLMGFRRFSTRYLLNSLDTKGEYRPSFQDIQGMLTWTPADKRSSHMNIRTGKDGSQDTIYLPNERLHFSLFFNGAHNKYTFTPQNRETSFGTIQRVFRLFVAFEGREITEYLTGMGAFTITHKPTVYLESKYIFSAFQTNEYELYDVEGGYRLSDINTSLGDDNFNEILFDRGVGTFFQHGRNYLTANVLSAENRSRWTPRKHQRHTLNFGLRYQYQYIDDELSEWYGIDSAGYFELTSRIRQNTILQSWLVKGYLQDALRIHSGTKHTVDMVAGGRVIYNSLNGQLMFSPRMQFVLNSAVDQPRQYQLRFAAGRYVQPAFYREMRASDGTVYSQTPAQDAWHLILGGDYVFKAWDRDFKLFSEAYYKYLPSVIPYEVDNVRIRYYPQYSARAYAYGIDARLNGQFVKGVDSWASLSLMSTREDLEGDTLGYMKRPSDQRFTFSLYFQDEWPTNPTFKVHINFVYGSGLRFGPPGNIEQRSVLKAPGYQRVDIGFSKLISFRPKEIRKHWYGLRSAWLTLEVYNLLQRANTVSYTWIKDIYNTQFAIPNFLSQRLVNARLIIKF